MSDIVAATRAYESWLGGMIPLLRDDLRFKHDRMAESRFAFLRATYYRWAARWPELCPELARGVRVLAVGDLHVENYGTWRDAEARLVWGINDVDEVHVAAWSNDLVRLVASAILAREAGALALRPRDAAAAALDGYASALRAGGAPFVLEEEHVWLRVAATGRARDPDRFWAKITALPNWRGRLPSGARAALDASLPRPSSSHRLARRRSGLGSLGRPRVVAIARVAGGLLAREAKPLLPPAGDWVAGRPRPPQAAALLRGAVRARDPHFTAAGRWIVRRLAPHCVRIDLDDLPRRCDEDALLGAMGAEAANLHLATPRAARAILADLRLRRGRWLADAASRMAEAVDEDWRAWRRG